MKHHDKRINLSFMRRYNQKGEVCGVLILETGKYRAKEKGATASSKILVGNI